MKVLNITRNYVLADIISYMEGVIKSFSLFLLVFAVYGLVKFVCNRLFWRKHVLGCVLDAVMKNDNVTCIKLIEKYPAVVNVSHDKAGYTPFLVACMNGNTQLVKYMISKGADINSCTAKRESPMYLAAYNHLMDFGSRDATCLHALYYAGADINARNEKGLTPLQLAAVFGHTSLLKWLLSKGANYKVRPDPYILAKSQGHLQTAAVLKTRQCLRLES